MPLTLSALKAELQADPLGLGYGGLLSIGNHAGVADLLNDPTKGGTLQLPSAESDLIRSQIIESEYTGLSAANKNYLGFLLNGSRVYLTAAVKAWVNALPNFTVSKTAAGVLFSRPQSRAEALFGEGVIVGHADIALALAS